MIVPFIISYFLTLLSGFTVSLFVGGDSWDGRAQQALTKLLL